MTGSPAVEEPAPDDKSLAVQAHALRSAADLIENAGFPGLSLVINDAGYSPEISIQVPEYRGSPAERTAAVARLAAAVGVTVTRTQRPGLSYAWVRAAGETGGHSVRIYTHISDADASLPFPGTSLDDQAARLFTLARWCRNSARAELRDNGWNDGQEAAFTRSFEDLVDTWGTYKCILAFLPGADGENGRPAREQALAGLERPRRAFAGALAAYNARLLEAAAHAHGPQPPVKPNASPVNEN